MQLTIVRLGLHAILAERCIHCRGTQRLFPGWSKKYLNQGHKETR